jgi:hypothetical protein
MASAGCEPANLGTRGQHATPTPPKPLESLTSSLKTLKFANVQICQNVRIARSLLRSELGGVVSCQNSIMGKLKRGVCDSLQIICLWLCIGTTTYGEVLN